ncbi:ATP-binding protein, partial [Streptomyces olivaceus]|uniref:ATP-binding protein n=1 Tax=Streptomyces olivaceus TaxID=47716 RepID=UPI00365AFEF0
AVTQSHAGDAGERDVTDDRVGFDPAAVSPPGPEGGGYGLAAMRARVHALDGTLTVESAPGRGTALVARLPLPPATDDEPEAQP